jgi:hypothetical protein
MPVKRALPKGIRGYKIIRAIQTPKVLRRAPPKLSLTMSGRFGAFCKNFARV